MTEMVERVARAIDPKAWDRFDRFGGHVWACEDSLKAARAAIAAMREPGHREVAIVEAGYRAADADYYHGDKLGYDQVAVTWRAMIDAALQDDAE